MRNIALTAVIADISREEALQTAHLVEDMGYAVSRIVNDGKSAADACVESRASLLVADAVLPVLDGLAAAEMTRRLSRARKPSAIITAYKGMTLKPKSPGICVLDKPLSARSLACAIDITDVAKRTMPDRTRAIINGVLQRLGFDGHRGCDYLADAAFLASEDSLLLTRLTGMMYPMIALRAGESPAAIERAIRHAIETAWSRGDIDVQYELFGSTIDAARGKPTSGEMIARLTELTRMEDRR